MFCTSISRRESFTLALRIFAGNCLTTASRVLLSLMHGHASKRCTSDCLSVWESFHLLYKIVSISDINILYYTVGYELPNCFMTQVGFALSSAYIFLPKKKEH